MNYIITNYHGHTFRSIMEARWAVFFDYFRFRWDYEPVGFELGTEKYLPDFYIKDFDLYVEVKHTDGEETERAKRFARDRKFNLVICDGNPHCGPLLFVAGRPDFDLPVDTTKVLWYFKPGQGLLYEAKGDSQRPEYAQAVKKANNTRFKVMEIKTMLGQARSECGKTLKAKLLELKDKHGIPHEDIKQVMDLMCEFNEITCMRTLQETYKKKIDGLQLELDPTFEYNKGLKL